MFAALTSVLPECPSLLLVTLAAVAITFYKWRFWTFRNYPPGPLPLPFIGHPFIYADNPAEKIAALAPKDAEIFTVYSGSNPIVILNSPEVVHSAFVKNADFFSERTPYQQRPHSPGYVASGYTSSGFADIHWKALRKHSLNIFKEKGVGKKGMEGITQEEAVHLLAEFMKHAGSPFDAELLLKQAVSNVISHIIFNERFPYGDSKLRALDFQEFIHMERIRGYFPLVKLIPEKWLGFDQLRKRFRQVTDFLHDQVSRHRETIDRNSPRDYIDSFIMQTDGEDGHVFTDGALLATCMGMYSAGTDSTASSLYWALLYCLLQPDTQEKIQTEIDQIIGEKPVEYTDRGLMHLTQSFITEILRITVAVMSLDHYTTEDVEIHGVKIPKGTVVMANQWAIMHDEKYFPEPHKFKADRFLDKERKFVRPDQKIFLPFSTGRRSCLGEPLARMELFIFFVNILQKFRIENVPGQSLSDESAIINVLSPKSKFSIMLKPRL